MVQSNENRGRNGHVLIWDQPGLQNEVQKPQSNYSASVFLFQLFNWLLTNHFLEQQLVSILIVITRVFTRRNVDFQAMTTASIRRSVILRPQIVVG